MRTSRRAVPELLFALALLAAGCGRAASPPAPAARAFDPDSIPEAYRHSVAALAWPGATRAFEVTPAGDLYNGEWRLRISAPAMGRLSAPMRVP